MAEINREIQELKETYNIAIENINYLSEHYIQLHKNMSLIYKKNHEYYDELDELKSSDQDKDNIMYKNNLIMDKLDISHKKIDQLKKQIEELKINIRELEDIINNIRIELEERRDIQFQLEQRIRELENEDGQMVDYHEQMRLERLEREGLGFEIHRPDNVPLERKFEETLKWKEIDFDDIPDEMTSCPICMDDFNEDDRIIQHIRRDHQNGGCGNVFHFSCINRAARGANPNCPMCGRHFGTH